MFTKTKPLTATIHKNKRRTFVSEQILAPSGAVQKVVHMAKQGLTALVYLTERTGVLESVLEGRVTEECLCMYNVDGSMWKIVKSKLFEQFNLDPVTEELEDHISCIDMGMIWHLATLTHDDCEARKRDGSGSGMVQTTGWLSLQVHWPLEKDIWLHPFTICRRNSHHPCQWQIRPPVQYQGWRPWLKGSKMVTYLKYHT